MKSQILGQNYHGRYPKRVANDATRIIMIITVEHAFLENYLSVGPERSDPNRRFTNRIFLVGEIILNFPTEKRD